MTKILKFPSTDYLNRHAFYAQKLNEYTREIETTPSEVLLNHLLLLQDSSVAGHHDRCNIIKIELTRRGINCTIERMKNNALTSLL